MLNGRSSLTRRLLALTGTFARALRLLLIATLLVVALGTAPAPARPVQAAPGGPVSPEGLLNPDGTLDLSTGFQGALDLRGWQVTLDGERGPVLEPASLPDAFQVTAWHPLPKEGLNDMVRALAVVGSDLYVGGDFAQTGDASLTDLGHIARYDTTGNTWHPLPRQGLNNWVEALAVVGSDLYVGGDFTGTGDGTLPNLGRIVRYDTTTNTWHALPKEGLNNPVYALAVSGSDLYVGGFFTQTGDGAWTNLGRIARYETTANTWNPLPRQGLDHTVFALAVVASDLYVGGWFSQTGDGTLTNLGNIARYDTTANTWNELPKEGLNDMVRALAVVGSDLYVGGDFTQTGDASLTDLGYIVRYDTTDKTWHALPKEGLDNHVHGLAVSGSDLYVGGSFTQTGDGTLTNLGGIARYDITANTWSALPNQGLGMGVINFGVNALAVVGSDLYVGGRFDQTGDTTLTNLGNIARGALAVPKIQVLNVYLPLVTRK